MIYDLVKHAFPEGAAEHAFWVFPRSWRVHITWKYRREIKNFARINTKISTRPDPAYAKRIDSFWIKHYGKKVNKAWHAAYASVNGLKDERYIPKDVLYAEILPRLNRRGLANAYEDKNRYAVNLEGAQLPVTLVKNINGDYYRDEISRPIPRQSAFEHLTAHEGCAIIKPSLNSGGGKRVKKLFIHSGEIFKEGERVSFEALEADYGKDFIIQAEIEQHSAIRGVHSSSVNTLRLTTFRFHGEIHLLSTMVRFGNGGSVIDNLSAGGLICGVDEAGHLNKCAFDKYGQEHERHPFSGYAFQEILIPKIDAFSEQAVFLHHQLPYFDLVSWDFAIGPHAEPILVELNLGGVHTVYQIVNGPLFGSFTEELLEDIRDGHYISV